VPKARISMSKIREIIRLKEESGLSIRQISRALTVSRPVVTEYCQQRFQSSALGVRTKTWTTFGRR
jgi:predicted XRE-type DNA-binding protein